MTRTLKLAALAVLMTSGAVHAGYYDEQHGVFGPRFGPGAAPPVQETNLDKLYNAYRYYGIVQYCHTIREGYLVVYVNDVEFDRAREKVKSIETDLLLSINATGSHGGPNEQKMFKNPNSLDTEILFKQAIDSVKGTPISRDTCQQVWRKLIATPSSGGNIKIEKDF